MLDDPSSLLSSAPVPADANADPLIELASHSGQSLTDNDAYIIDTVEKFPIGIQCAEHDGIDVRRTELQWKFSTRASYVRPMPKSHFSVPRMCFQYSVH
jgi:hypothetical protein